MSQSNQEKSEVSLFIAPDGYKIGQIVGTINKQSEDFQNIIDLITNDRSLRISDNRGKIAKDLIAFARRVLLSYEDHEKFGTLSNPQLQEIIGMLNDVINGKREAVHFQMNRNCDGLKELFSTKEFKINQKTQSGKK